MKWLIWGVTASIGASLTALGVWYVVPVLPHLADVRRLMHREHEAIVGY